MRELGIMSPAGRVLLLWWWMACVPSHSPAQSISIHVFMCTGIPSHWFLADPSRFTYYDICRSMPVTSASASPSFPSPLLYIYIPFLPSSYIPPSIAVSPSIHSCFPRTLKLYSAVPFYNNQTVGCIINMFWKQKRNLDAPLRQFSQTWTKFPGNCF